MTKYSSEYLHLCKQTDDNEQGGLTFEIEKGRFGFKLTTPYSEHWRKAASVLARKNAYNQGGKVMENIISCKFNMGCLEPLLSHPLLIKCIAFCVEICDNKFVLKSL